MPIPSADAVDAKLREFHGNMAAVARVFGVTRQAIWKYVDRRKALKEVKTECREVMKDNAESALYKAVLNGEAWAVCFFLKTQAKDRGYVERQEHDHSTGNRTQFVEEIVEAPPGPATDSSAQGANGVPR